ncbi:MAG: MTH1187 family thiamine-binding protein [Pirellulales bacterium]
MEFSVAPMNAGDSVSPYVARCVELVAASGLDYQLHAMGTLVEGELPQLLSLLERCMNAVSADCDRVTCSAKFDAPRGRPAASPAKSPVWSRRSSVR